HHHRTRSSRCASQWSRVNHPAAAPREGRSHHAACTRTCRSSPATGRGRQGCAVQPARPAAQVTMALVYLDTSALVKLCVLETGTPLAVALWEGADALVTSRIADAEVQSVLSA